MPVRSYRDDLIAELKRNPKEAVAYLNATLEDDDPRVFLLALRDVADAWGGLKKLAGETNLNRESMYRMLSLKGNPSFTSLTALLESLGMKLAVHLGKPKRGKRDSGRKPHNGVRSGKHHGTLVK
ncbi:MAG: putative addiction module antidote protein [Nitrospinae bacterium]|nr:putative addiction module antidote protein [Nitrospinota bacterium]